MVSKCQDLHDGSKWNDEDIVITGISGRFPECDSVEEFREKLLAGINLISDDPRRWQNGLHGSLSTYGMLKDLTRFDSEFFDISPKQADRMDPQVRNLLEVVYEALIDAGLHPDDLSESKTGVVVGVASSETHYKWCQMPDRINGYEYTGCTRTMFANRVSYKFNLKGPSYSIDTASSTTLVAFQQAYDMIEDGICEACFVCGTDLVLNPSVCLMFQHLNMLSPEGKCKAFDASGDGYVRSEGAIAVLLQKAKNAKRVYAKVLAAGSNCDGYKDDGITFPSGPQQIALFRRVAEIAGINPASIDFMEAHGSATRVGDPQEMNAVTEVFVKGRTTPLMTGSIKSNMGHGEPASALSAVIKVCIAMECGVIPPNLHYNIPNPDIPALHDGRLQVITEPTSWNGGTVAVNSFGVGGANGHALLLSNKKPKQITSSDNLPRLVCVSGTTPNAVKTFLNKINTLSKDPELYGLLYNIHRKNIKGHLYRGYAVVGGHDGMHVNRKKLITISPSLCLILPGIESNLKHVKCDMFNVEIFRKTLEKCEHVVRTIDKTVRLIDIVRQEQLSTDSLSSTLAITSLQVCYIDVLRHLDVLPDYIIGSNIGEVAAGYADGVYTLEQTILIAYRIGSMLNNLQQQITCLALIAEPPDTDKYDLPSDVAILMACNNNNNNNSNGSSLSGYSVIWGETEVIRKFCHDLTSTTNIWTRIKDVGQMPLPKLLRNVNSNCEQLIEKILLENPKPTSKWLTYAHRGKLDKTAINAVASHLVRTAWFPSTLEVNSLVVDNVNFLAIDVDNFLDKYSKLYSGHSIDERPSLIQTNNSSEHFLQSVGKLYLNGFQPQIQNLYHPITYPVSHGTPMIQSMIEWDHARKWNVVSFAAKEPAVTGEVKIVVYFDRKEFSYLVGNKLHGEHVFPKSFYLMLVWKTLSRLQTKPIIDISLVIENIYFAREVFITETDTVFYIDVLGSCGKFEIWESNRLVCYGTVRIPEDDITKEYLFETPVWDDSSDVVSTKISTSDIYNVLRVAGYDYNDKLRTLLSYDYRVNSCSTTWTGNWTAFLESVLQMYILDTDCTLKQYTLSHIKKIVIDPKRCWNENLDSSIIVRNRQLNVITGRGIEIRGIEIKKSTSKIPHSIICSEHYSFVPFFTTAKIQAAKSKEIGLRIAIENWTGSDRTLKICEISPFEFPESILAPRVCNAYPEIQMDITVYTRRAEYLSVTDIDNEINLVKYVYGDVRDQIVDGGEIYDIVICSNVIGNSVALTNVIASLLNDGCLVTEERFDCIDDDWIAGLRVLSMLPSVNDGKCFVVLKKVSPCPGPETVPISTDWKGWPRMVNEILNESEKDVLLVANSLTSYEILNYLKFMKKQTQRIRLLMTDGNEWDYSSHSSFFEEQLGKKYPVNILLTNGIWGCYLAHEISDKLRISTDSAYIGFCDEGDIDYVQKYRKLNCSPSSKTYKVYSACITEDDVETMSVSSVNCQLHSEEDDISSSGAGMEFAGVDVNNNRVFGLVEKGALASDVTVSKTDLIWNIPHDWSFEQAATVPLAYSLAYYALTFLNELEETTSRYLLVFGSDSASSALLNVCVRRSIKSFIVVETEIELDYVKKLFPTIRVLLYNNGNFYADILERTDWKGVDLVFSSKEIDSHHLRAFVSVLSENGTFVYKENRAPADNLLGSAGNMKCITFKPFSTRCFWNDKSILNNLHRSIEDGIKSGHIKPLEFSVFDYDQSDLAIRAVLQCSQVKTVIRLRKENNEKPDVFWTSSKVYFEFDSVYIVFLDETSNSGLYVIDWMVTRGIKHLSIVSTVSNGDNVRSMVNFFVNRWRNRNVRVEFQVVRNYSSDICESIIERALKVHPVIRGIFDITELNICDKSDQSVPSEYDLIVESTSKISLVKNMDKISRKLCPNLEHFVVFGKFKDFGKASLTTSYVNGLLEKIIHERIELNYPATIINWSIMDECSERTDKISNDTNVQPIPVVSSIGLLDKFLKLSQPVISCYSVRQTIGDVYKSKVNEILEGVAKFLGIKDPKSIRPTITLLELGLDSLIGTDIQNFLQENCRLILDTQEIRKLTFESLRSMIDERK